MTRNGTRWGSRPPRSSPPRRARGGGLDLPAQLFHVAVDRAVADDALVGIDPIHQLAAGIDAPRVRCQEMEQLELHGREGKGNAAEGRLVAILVEETPVTGGGRRPR